MDALAVPKTVLDELHESKGQPNLWSDEYTKTVTDWARQFGVTGALKRHQAGDFKDKNLPWTTADRYDVLPVYFFLQIFRFDIRQTKAAFTCTVLTGVKKDFRFSSPFPCPFLQTPRVI
jgi:hypothetical protein